VESHHRGQSSSLELVGRFARRSFRVASLVIAPRGHALPHPNLMPLKKGTSLLAIQAEVPMVSIVIRNAGQVMPPHSTILTAGTVHVRVLEPASTADRTAAELDEQGRTRRRCVRARSTTGLVKRRQPRQKPRPSAASRRARHRATAPRLRQYT
jgi:1-acyl-sn-glycerol-3-phosphate acyltransferase